jgi:hypothetical protein
MIEVWALTIFLAGDAAIPIHNSIYANEESCEIAAKSYGNQYGEPVTHLCIKVIAADLTRKTERPE